MNAEIGKAVKRVLAAGVIGGDDSSGSSLIESCPRLAVRPDMQACRIGLLRIGLQSRSPLRRAAVRAISSRRPAGRPTAFRTSAAATLRARSLADELFYDGADGLVASCGAFPDLALGERRVGFGERPEDARQPRRQTVRQKADGRMALRAIPASNLRTARGLPRVGAVACQRTSTVRVIRVALKPCIAPRLGPNVFLAGKPRLITKLHRPWPGGDQPARASFSFVVRPRLRSQTGDAKPPRRPLSHSATIPGNPSVAQCGK